MHLGGEGESRGEPRSSRSRSRRSRAESSRVESRPAMVWAHAPPTDASVCTLLARSLGELTRASENAGESRSADRDTYASSVPLNRLEQCCLYLEKQKDCMNVLSIF
ncbi:hypothetical protein ALC56_12224 [Trachymyrmex septentrionalis]|uniref:Uncharacterized protein n=1 Tax=Trachymyrmex septentrionalis TaxID=34720 RepID=A0A195F025_9HYME|nr:hypothetical protein ALC56_12224 [Trachymyrmex septentrionalis]